MNKSPDEIRRHLSELARPIAERIAEKRRSVVLYQAIETVWPWFLAAPVARLVLAFVGFEVPGVRAFVVLAPLVPALVVLLAYISRDRNDATRREALIYLDDKLGLGDRMNTAAEFLAAKSRTPFMKAAIQDAQRQISAAAKKYVSVATPSLVIPRQAFYVFVAALVLYLLPTYSPKWRPESKIVERVEMAQVPKESHEVRTSEPKSDAKIPSVDNQDAKQRQPRVSDEQDSDVKEAASPEEDSEKVKRSSPSSGRSSQTNAAGGNNASRGEASRQSQPSKAGDVAKQKGKRKDQREPEDRAEKEREKTDEKESGATSGRGSGRGSSKSPTASSWASKDQVTSKEDQDLEDDEEVEDDFDESKARGGVQPQLRSRKPPVNRDLQIGFGGGRPNPMANGRGGAGPPKKQRGVAQLVLGVHFPDQISGRPNPGMSKITQEQIEPQPEAAEGISAEARGARKSAFGQVSRPSLLPWMQTLVKNYFMSRVPEL